MSGVFGPSIRCTISSLLCHGILTDERLCWKVVPGWQLRSPPAQALAHLSFCWLSGSHDRPLVCSPARPPTRSHACSIAWPPASPSADSDLFTTWLLARTGFHVSDRVLITRLPARLFFLPTDHQVAGIDWPLASMSTYTLTAALQHCRASLRQHFGISHGPVSQHSYIVFLTASPALLGSLYTQRKASCMDRLSHQLCPCCFVITCLYICVDFFSGVSL